MAFRGRVRLAEVDEANRRVKIVGQARERAGAGSAHMTLGSGLTALPGGETQVVAIVEMEVAGRIADFGRGFLQELGHQFFQEFAQRVATSIEAREAERAGGPAAAPAKQGPLRVLPLVMVALRAWLSGLLRRPESRTPRH
jgi:hypothetical protein